MANSGGHRQFGSVRKLPSGRYQARYLGPDGVVRSAPRTFARKDEATRWLSLTEAQLVRDEWVAPERARVLLKDYAERWIIERPNLRPRTIALYTWILNKHITPYLGARQLGQIDTPAVRNWRSELIAAGVSQSGAAKAYRLLRAVLMTAVKEDEILRRNPCRLVGADQEKAAERPVLTIPQVFSLADKVPDRYRALILVATFGCLRWGEVIALRRADFDAARGTVRVREAFSEHRGKGLVLGPVKSRAGVRTISLPPGIARELSRHLSTYVKDKATAFIFTTESGTTIWRGNFNTLVSWKKVVGQIGSPGLHFHDLRHTGNTLAAQTGTSLRDLMARMGHDSPRAALIYQHASATADAATAAALDAFLAKAGVLPDEEEESPEAREEDGDDGAAGVPAKVS